MYLTESPEDGISIGQINAELRQAELDLLSAQCVTHKLRLSFSTEDLARHGRRDILRRSLDTASALSDYYASIEKKISAEKAVSAPGPGLDEQQITRAVELVSSYLLEQRERHLPSAAPLSQQHRAIMQPYFSAALLNQVKVVELQGARTPNPPFYEEAKALGVVNLPEIAHMNSLTFLDVLVFNDEIAERSLFHALVHAVQFQVLGLQRYTDLFVRSFVKTKFHFMVPVEAHAFCLESKFAQPTAEGFSVEEQVRLWAKQNRY